MPEHAIWRRWSQPQEEFLLPVTRLELSSRMSRLADNESETRNSCGTEMVITQHGTHCAQVQWTYVTRIKEMTRKGKKNRFWKKRRPKDAESSWKLWVIINAPCRFFWCILLQWFLSLKLSHYHHHCHHQASMSLLKRKGRKIKNTNRKEIIRSPHKYDGNSSMERSTKKRLLRGSRLQREKRCKGNPL